MTSKKTEKMDALLFIDANIFLDFYRARDSDISIKFLKQIEACKDSLIISSQLDMEYKKNRQKVIVDSLKKYGKPDWSKITPPVIVSDFQPVKMINDRKNEIIMQQKKVNEKINTYAKENQIESVDGIGTEIAKSVVEYFSVNKNKEEIKTMLDSGIKISKDSLIEGDKFLGKSICITGKLKNYSREELSNIIVKQQGKVVSSVSKNTDILISGENSGSKLEKAKSLNIKVMNVNQFLNL